MRKLIHKRDDGFTLIELLIVIAILAILVSIVSLSFGEIMQTTDETAMGDELRLVRMAVDRYNSWDVYVMAGTEITANGSLTELPAASAPFSKYLATPSRYCYTWEAKGLNLFNAKCP